MYNRLLELQLSKDPKKTIAPVGIRARKRKMMTHSEQF